MTSSIKEVAKKVSSKVLRGLGQAPKTPDRKMLQYSAMSQEIIEFCGDLQGKTILEVGCGTSKDCLSKYVADNFCIQNIIAIDPLAKPFMSETAFEIRPEDIRHTTFADNQFDLIISIAAFEHIPDFEVALSEMYRVLKPGGILYTKFGPIWSGPWGHHLWTKGSSKLFTYSNTSLPPYCHFLMSEEELRNHCHDVMGLASDDVAAIANFLYHSEDQNRLFYSDYEEIVEKSPFNTLFFYGINKFPLPAEYKVHNYREMMLKLLHKYPSKSGCTYNSIFMMLHKPYV
jgi:SAM-dependent methyltransferase